MKKLITSNDIISFLKLNPLLKPLVALGMNALGFRKINKLYSPSADLKNREFTEDMLRIYNTTFDVDDNELNNIPKDGPFMIVSNHPFGAMEGIILYHVISKVRPDFKVMANFILSYIPNLKDVFFAVNPFSDNPEWKSSVNGIKASLQQLKEGHGLGVFPAGEVSRYHGHDYPDDIAWAPSIAKIIQKTNVPVIPVYFDGTNSRMFYFCSKINSFLATLRLVRELLNKRNTKIVMKIGKPMLQSELSQYESPETLSAYLRSRSYALQANIAAADVRKTVNKSYDPIDAPSRPSELARELHNIKEKSLLFSTADYECYLADYDDIPNMMHEIGRRREEAFRAVGEGTGNNIDTDSYDAYYKHLILWDSKQQAVAGGYRIGLGDEIIKKYGIKGFYINSLFSIDPSLENFLSYTMELGRSYVSVDYQKDIFPLMLLFKGLMLSIVKYPEMKYFIGPVSISSWFPKFYQSIIVHYVKTKHSDEEMSRLITPKTPFVPDFNKVDVNVLMEKNMDSVDKFDRYLMKLSNGDFRMPTLFKKYLKINAKFLCFNVDPDFNNTLDGLLFLRFEDYPKEELMMLIKDNTPEEKARYAARFGISLD